MRKNYDMQRKCDKKKGRAAGKPLPNQDFIYQHMSNHYRKILNAKKTVDTSPPYCYKPKKATSNAQKAASESKTNNHVISSKNAGPLLTDRSASTNSCKNSLSGTESLLTSSRYHAACVPEATLHVPLKFACVDMELVEQIAFDTKRGPTSYYDVAWHEVKATQDGRFKHSSEPQVKKTPPILPSAKRRYTAPRLSETSITKLSEPKLKRELSIKVKSSPSVISSPNISSINIKHNTRVLKTEAVSKLRGLRVYYPPRRKAVIPEVSEEEMDRPYACSPKSPNCFCYKDEDIQRCQKASSNVSKENQTSSRDSAYNGGVSSAPQSRSPTPDQTKDSQRTLQREVEEEYSVKEKLPTLEKSTSTTTTLDKDDEQKEKKEQEEKEERGEEEQVQEEQEEGEERVEEEKCKPRVLRRTTSSEPRLKRQSRIAMESEPLRRLQEEGAYIKFVQDITVEILEKNLYTNKALKKVMKKHILKNINVLDKERMMSEVDSLRVQLGIPDDQNFLDLTTGVKDSSSDMVNSFPIISDSEFVPAKAAPVKRDSSFYDYIPFENFYACENANGRSSLSDEFPRSISQILRNSSSNVEMAFASESEDEGEEDLISVIRIANAIREKRKDLLAGKKITLVEEGKRFGCKKKPPGFKKDAKIKLSESSSLSSTETEERYLEEKIKQNPEYEDSSSRDDSLYRKPKKKNIISEKKPRIVSFRNNKDYNKTNFFELKIKKVTKPLKKQTS